MDTQSLITLWNLTQQHKGTSAARVASGVLLSLYNGNRFPFDLTDLRILDSNHLSAALSVISSDAHRCQREVHEWLNQLTGRCDFGDRFEHLAHEYATTKRGRCKVSFLADRPINPPRLIIQTDPMQEAA